MPHGAVTKTPIRLESLFRYWRGLPHQSAAIVELEQALLKASPDLLNRDQPWFHTWSQDGKQLDLQQPAAKLTPDSPFNSRITPHVTLGEFALEQEARRFDHQYQLDTATELAAFLERVRSHFNNKPIVITSGYRPPKVNTAVGGARSSEHLYSKPGEGAVDFYIHGVPIQAVQDWCDTNWRYSVGYGAPKGFVHLGRRSDGLHRRWNY